LSFGSKPTEPSGSVAALASKAAGVMAMRLDDRCRDNNGEIRRKNGATRVGTLRQTYGEGFAPGATKLREKHAAMCHVPFVLPGL
jgi:hypothetical protein